MSDFIHEEVNLSELSIEELWTLHYEREKYFADLIKKTNPFSTERTVLMKNGYEAVSKIMIERNKKEGKQLNSYGASDAYIKLIKKILVKKLRENGKCLFFEAGVGTGKIINAVANLKNVTVIGCDVSILQK